MWILLVAYFIGFFITAGFYAVFLKRVLQDGPPRFINNRDLYIVFSGSLLWPIGLPFILLANLICFILEY